MSRTFQKSQLNAAVESNREAMKKFLVLVNVKTFIVLSIALLSSFLAVHYEFKIHYNFILLGLLIVFPIVKSFQFAFRRRERALEYLSHFRGGLITVNQFIQHSTKLTLEDKAFARDMIFRISDTLLNHLRLGLPAMKDVYAQLDEISLFMEKHPVEIGGRTASLIIRNMRDVQISTTYLISLTRHRTVLFLRLLSLIFISIFPIIHAPLMNYLFFDMPFLVYLLTCTTAIALITLYNVQNQLERPFDQYGFDDIHLEDFRVSV